MRNIYRLFKLTFSSISQSVIGSLILVVMMTLSVIAFNRVIGYIRYQNGISEAFLESDLSDKVLFGAAYLYYPYNEEFLNDIKAVAGIDGVVDIGHEIRINFNMKLDKSQWKVLPGHNDEPYTMKEKRDGVLIYDELAMNSINIPLKKGVQLKDAKNLPEDVYPILVSDDKLEYFPYGKTREISLMPNGIIKSEADPDSEIHSWNPKVKVQTVGVTRPGAPVITLTAGSFYSGYRLATITSMIRFMDKSGPLIMAMPKEHKEEIMRYGIPGIKGIVKVEEGYSLEDIAKKIIMQGMHIGASPLDNLVDDLRMHYKRDIFRYLIDFAIFTIISVVAIGGFYILMMRKQRENLSIYFMCGASWKSCILADIIRGIFVVAIPGGFAMLVEWLRVWMTDSGFSKALIFLQNFMSETEASNFIWKYGLTSETGNEMLINSGIYVDERTFIYSFLFIVAIYFMSSIGFHISMLRTKPADEIRQWQ